MSRVYVDEVGTEYEVFGAGRPVVLLHGFPDTGRLWRHQAPVLADAGFQVIVPDLRGYGRSDKPEAVAAYSMRILAGDVMAIFAALGVGKAHVVGHDWGAALANFRNWSGHPDADQVIAELEANGSLTPALNYYRANIPPERWVAPPLQLPPVQAPTMGVWSTGDIALTEAQMTASAGHVAGPWRYERLDGPGHWMQLEAPDRVSELMLDFLPR